MNQLTAWSSRMLCVTFLSSATASAQYAPNDPAPDLTREQLAAHAQFLADLADRPRRVIYTPYPVSPLRGLVVGFVHLSDGTAVLSRTDLVVDSPFPIVIRRAYHSGGDQSSDFGTCGWRLTVAEQITRQPGARWRYVHGNGNSIEFDAQGRFVVAAEQHFSDVLAFRRTEQSAVEIATRLGLLKTFREIGRAYRLVDVVDGFGNRLSFRYTPRGDLVDIEGSNGTLAAFERDVAGRIVSARDSLGRRVGYGYSALGCLDTVTDVGGQVWKYDYDVRRRLVATETPSGVVDTEFTYDQSGRVRSSRANGARSRFVYAGRTTTVTDSKNLMTRYRASKSGLTTEVVNALGTRTTVRLSRDELPVQLERNGTTIVNFAYAAAHDVLPAGARFVSPRSGENYQLAYDSRGRVVTASDSRGPLYTALYGAALTPQSLSFPDGNAEGAQFDSTGDLVRYAKRDGTYLTFERTGQRWRISNASGKAADLEFDLLGRLLKAVSPYGIALTFGYNHVGLRELTETSYGARVRYQYDASGSLFHSSMSYGERILPAYTYVLGMDQRVDAVRTSDGDLYEFRYDERGLLENVNEPSGESISYLYDDRARLTRAQYRSSPPVDYSYAPGEPDIAAQLSYRAVPVYNQQREISDLASRFDVALTRIRPATLGLLTYDEVAGEITLAADPSRWNPLSAMARSLGALQVEALLSDPEDGIQSFSNPANRFFVPREYWSVNCCICICPPGSPAGAECNQD